MKITAVHILGVALVGLSIYHVVTINGVQKQAKEFGIEFAKVKAERDSIQHHSNGVESKWASAESKLNAERVRSDKIRKVADSLQVVINTKSRIVLQQKAIIADLKSKVVENPDGTATATFGHAECGLHIDGTVQFPSGTTHLDIQRDPLELLVHIGHTKSGFTKGFIEVKDSCLTVSDWQLIVDKEPTLKGGFSRTFPDLRLSGALGGGSQGYLVGIGARSGGWGVSSSWTGEGMYLSVEKEIPLLRRKE